MLENLPSEELPPPPPSLTESAKPYQPSVFKHVKEKPMPVIPTVELKDSKDQLNQQAEIEKMDNILPVENWARFEIRTSILIFVEKNIINQKDVPNWVYSEATAESLYVEGWRASSLEKSITDWNAFIKNNIQYLD